MTARRCRQRARAYLIARLPPDGTATGETAAGRAGGRGPVTCKPAQEPAPAAPGPVRVSCRGILRAGPEPVTVPWYQHAVAYAAMKWPSLPGQAAAGQQVRWPPAAVRPGGPPPAGRPGPPRRHRRNRTTPVADMSAITTAAPPSNTASSCSQICAALDMSTCSGNATTARRPAHAAGSLPSAMTAAWHADINHDSPGLMTPATAPGPPRSPRLAAGPWPPPCPGTAASPRCCGRQRRDAHPGRYSGLRPPCLLHPAP